MNCLRLVRNQESLQSTIGNLYYGENLICRTLELPWRDNKKDVSCIPTGEYELAWTFSSRFQKNTWQLMNVPARTGIRIHSANLASELQGCIAPVTTLVPGTLRWFGTYSRDALTKLELLLIQIPSCLIKIS